MTTMNDNNGCSICAAGSENYETFNTRIGRKRVKRVQYDYRHTDGELFSCIGGDNRITPYKPTERESLL